MGGMNGQHACQEDVPIAIQTLLPRDLASAAEYKDWNHTKRGLIKARGPPDGSHARRPTCECKFWQHEPVQICWYPSRSQDVVRSSDVLLHFAYFRRKLETGNFHSNVLL